MCMVLIIGIIIYYYLSTNKCTESDPSQKVHHPSWIHRSHFFLRLAVSQKLFQKKVKIMVVYKLNVTLNPRKTNKDNPKLFEQIQ